ncbi:MULTISPECIES: 2-phospho-L-lactate guanylyltransferase [unclassified Rhodococcus (in: high G+C Gram-positive bacteria)]|uniref:2-phospho-L-lactate guanylyltransferase n=1 Tax=Rhodococcus sp. SJ-3 TaxID=3454628 RepID=UPI003F7A1A5A
MTAVHVLVPVKALGLAKTRLAHVFDPATRSDLVVAMLIDTLAAALGLPGSVATVVTSDPVATEVAFAHGARVLPDPAYRGESDPLNAALGVAAARIRAQSPEAELVALHADLPALRSSELSAALTEARRFGRAIVADHTGDGTAALFQCTPGRPLGPMFGIDSARRHVRSGARALTQPLDGLRMDVDTLDDLEAAVRLGTGDATSRILGRIGFALTERSPGVH